MNKKEIRFFVWQKIFVNPTDKTMNRFLVIIVLSLLLHSCNDGDVIVTDFNFENAPLQTCGQVGNYVFYKVNSQVFESLSLRLGTTDSIYKTEGEKIYELAGNTNFVNYRSYDGPLGNNYFCSSIPPTAPKVEVDYLAVSGTVLLNVTFEQEDQTLRKSVQIVLKDVVLVSGDNQIIPETLNMGTIENVEVIELIP